MQMTPQTSHSIKVPIINNSPANMTLSVLRVLENFNRAGGEISLPSGDFRGYQPGPYPMRGPNPIPGPKPRPHSGPHAKAAEAVNARAPTNPSATIVRFIVVFLLPQSAVLGSAREMSRVRATVASGGLR